MHSQPPKSPLSGGLWKLREVCATYRDSEIPPTEELNDPEQLGTIYDYYHSALITP